MMVLAVDLATRTGCAYGATGTSPTTWAVDFGRFKDHDARLAQVLRWVRHQHDTICPDLIAVEAPIGGKEASALLIGMAACVRAQAADLGIASVFYASSSVRKHFLGKALVARDFPGLGQAAAKLAIKGKVLQRCKALGWEVGGLDEADAAALWDYACARESTAHQMHTVGGLFGEQQ
mgnify:CR=1 FL=1